MGAVHLVGFPEMTCDASALILIALGASLAIGLAGVVWIIRLSMGRP
jgi:hypothetical protein